MKKTLFMMLAIIVIIGGIVTSMFMMNKEHKNQANDDEEKQENLVIADKVSDECIDEYENLNMAQTEEANSKDVEKLSPNAEIVFEKFYKQCEHTISKKEQISNNLVNFTQEDIEKKYSNWKIKSFSNEKVVLIQEIDGECGEHYMLRDVDGKIYIYKLDEIGNETLINETDIATKYLTETDMINIENGLIVYGRESLNKLLEDFE